MTVEKQTLKTKQGVSRYLVDTVTHNLNRTLYVKCWLKKLHTQTQAYTFLDRSCFFEAVYLSYRKHPTDM